MNVIKILAIILALNIFDSLPAQDYKDNKIRTLELGDKIPDFELPGVDDKMYSAGDFAGSKILVVIFTCNHCPTAQAYEDRILDLFEEFYKKGVAFIAISPNSNTALSLAECGYTDLDDSFESMKIRAIDKGFKFPYLFDGENSEASMKFGPVATPHVFIFDCKRELRYKGRIDDEESPYMKPDQRNTRDALLALLEGREISVKTTKTFGCSVKWPWKDEWKKQLIQQWSETPVTVEEIDSEGLSILLENQGEKLMMINVWASYCGPCVIEFPELVSIDRMYRGRKFKFVSLSMDRLSNLNSVLSFLEDQEAANDNFIWNGKNAYEAIEIVDPDWQGSLPYTLIVKPGGELVYRHSGPIDPLSVRKEIIGHLGRYFADDN